MEWAVNDRAAPVYCMRLPGVFRLIGDAGLQDYLDVVEHFERVDSPTWSGLAGRGKLTTRSHARVGLFGNPSDGARRRPFCPCVLVQQLIKSGAPPSSAGRCLRRRTQCHWCRWGTTASSPWRCPAQP